MKTFRLIQLMFLTLIVYSPYAGAQETRPNIVFMLSDDQSWDGLSVSMHPEFKVSQSEYIQTPNTAKLAAAGIRFSAAYAPAPVCSPTRISLQTGKSPAQIGWTRAGSTMTASDRYKLIPPPGIRAISQKEITIGELLQKAGYATAHYGKWHIDGGGPESHGYDESDGNTSNIDAAAFKDPNPVDIFGMADRAIDFMKRNQKAKKPFFIQLSFNALHYSENAKLESVQRMSDRVSAAGASMMKRQIQRLALAEDLDEGVGKVLTAIDALGLSGNTYVIYMSDNGGSEEPEGGLNGKKGSVWERGIRVPLIVRGPSIKPNTWSHQSVVGYDLFNTFCEIADISEPLPKGVEGGSLLDIFQGNDQPVKRPNDGLVFHFPNYKDEYTPHSSIILGGMKLIKIYESSELKLFNISKDISESKNLAEASPEQAEILHQKLNTYLADVGAKLPISNPEYDPSNPPAPQKKGRPGKKRMQNSQ